MRQIASMRNVMLAIIALVGACAGQANNGQGETRAEAADAVLSALAEDGFVGSVLVACGATALLSADYGVGELDGRTPSYWVASISKQFTASAVLQLAEQGRLGLDDPLSRYFPDAPSHKAAISIRQLLTHQSGLRQTYAADGIADRSDAARAIFAQDLAPAPGFTYSNDNYTLLAMIVEIVSGETFEDYVRAHLFAPAGIEQGGFWPEPGAFTPPLLAPQTGSEGRANWGFRGGHGMRMSVSDLHRWVLALDPGRILSAQSVALLYGPHVEVSGDTAHGMGWFWSDDPRRRWLWTRGSDSSGANAVLYRLAGTPLTIIAATNAGPAEAMGAGWSRRARDALQAIYADDACT